MKYLAVVFLAFTFGSAMSADKKPPLEKTILDCQTNFKITESGRPPKVRTSNERVEVEVIAMGKDYMSINAKGSDFKSMLLLDPNFVDPFGEKVYNESNENAWRLRSEMGKGTNDSKESYFSISRTTGLMEFKETSENKLLDEKSITVVTGTCSKKDTSKKLF